MNAENKIKYSKNLGKVILITLLIVFLIRTFLFEPFTVSTSQMESSLSIGDRVVVNRTSYGIRLPQTILTIPFTFDSIFGFKSYSNLIRLPNKRVFASEIKKNDVVLFNNPLGIAKNIDKKQLLVSRCVGLPGDTIVMRNGSFFLNGGISPLSSFYIEEYFLGISTIEDIKQLFSANSVPLRINDKSESGVVLRLNRLEAYIIRTNISDTTVFAKVEKPNENYHLIIPKKGMQIDLTPENLQVYANTFEQELGIRSLIIKNSLLIDGVIQEKYVFLNDYYWFLSDNSLNSIDSRSLGFIPFTHVIGKASHFWLRSTEKDNSSFSLFSKVY